MITEDKSECDSSIGAILNGKADCDGYSDAFYLIGSLVGLDVRYQHGDSLEKGLNAGLSSVFHVWNLVNINDTWRMIDVTWDDQGDYPFYVWFNVGQDVASLTHTWNEDMTIALTPETKREVSAENDFYVKDTTGIKECMNKVNEGKPEGFFIIAPGLKEDDIVEKIREITGISSGDIRYSDVSNTQTFDLSDSTVKDISALKNLSDLEYLNISGCPIEDYSPIEGLHIDEVFK